MSGNRATDYETIGKFVYGMHRAQFQLHVMMERMGTPFEAVQPGEDFKLAEEAAEAAAMFNRLRADADAKSDFATLMDELARLAGELRGVSTLDDAQAKECAIATAAASAALPRFQAIVEALN